MAKIVLFWLLGIILTVDILTAYRLRRRVIWDGHSNWALSCDFKGNDYYAVQIPSEQCGGICAATQGCTHFSWTSFNGGTCWMKQGEVSRDNFQTTTDPSMVCGVMNHGILFLVSIFGSYPKG